MRTYSRLAVLGAALALTPMSTALAQTETPKKGGILNIAVVAEPPTYDCHASTTFGVIHPVGPHYSTLLRYAGDWKKMYIEGDLAESWSVSPDGLTFTFKLRDGVKFHDGSPATSADVKA
ncbi:MAG: ABC transporter substrate-binding protein, partial [Bacteroidota bacterium]